MTIPYRRFARRSASLLAVAVLLLLPTACGTTVGGGAGGGSIRILGGSLHPNARAYELTPQSFEVLPGTPDAAVPDRVDLMREGYIPPVQNQRWNSCVTWTLGYVVMTAIEARLARRDGRWLDVTDPHNWFSPDYLYSQRDDDVDRAARSHLAQAPICRELDGELGCMRPERALELLVTQGCGKWSWMCDGAGGEAFGSCTPGPADVASLSSRRAWGPASLGAWFFRPRCYVRFGATLDALDVDALARMRQWLHVAQTPIAAVVRMTSGWVGYRGENKASALARATWLCDITEERAVCLDAGGEELGSEHMFAIVGYDDTFPSPESHPEAGLTRSGSFLVVNQWGEKWGDRGVMWIPYDELARIWVAGYAVLGREPGSASAPVGGGECVQDDQGQWIGLTEPDDVPRNLATDGSEVERSATELPAPDGMGTQEITGAIVADDPADWFWFTTTEDNLEVTVTLTGDDGSPLTLDAPLAADLRVLMTDAGLVPVAASDAPTSPGAPAVLRAAICGPGTWFLKVAPGANGEAAPYTLRVARATLDCGNGDDCICGAQPIDVVNGATSRIGPRGNGTVDAVDWYRFDLERPSAVWITLFHRDDADFTVWGGTTPATATLLGRGEEPTTGFSFIERLRLVLDRGRYYVRVEPEDTPTLSTDGEYLLRVSPQASFPGGAVPLTRVPGTNTGAPGPVRWTADVQVRNESGTGQQLEDPILIDVPEASLTTLSAQQPEPRLFTFQAQAHVAWPDDDSSPSRCGARWPSDDFSELVGATAPCQVQANVITTCHVDGQLAVPPLRGPGRIALDLAVEGGGVLDVHADVELVEPPERPDGISAANPRFLTLANSCSETIGRGDVEDHIWIERGAVEATWIVTVLDGCPQMEVSASDGAGVALPLVDLGSRPGAILKRMTVPAGAGRIWLRIATGPGQPLARYVVRAWEPAPLPFVLDVDAQVDPSPRAQTLTVGEVHADALGPTDRWDVYRVRVPSSGSATALVSLRLCTPAGSGALRVRAWSHRDLLHDAGSSCGAVPVSFPAPVDTMLTILVSADDGPPTERSYTLEVRSP